MKIKGIDIFEAAALSSVPASGYILCGHYGTAGECRYEIVIYKGLNEMAGNMDRLDFVFGSGSLITLVPLPDKKLRKTRKEFSEPFSYTTPIHRGKNFAFLFPDAPGSEELIEHFLNKELKYTRP